MPAIRLGSDPIPMRVTAALAALLFLLPAVHAQTAGPVVRVQVLGRAALSQPTLEGVGSGVELSLDGQPLASTAAGERVEVRASGPDVQVTVGGRRHQGRELTVDAGEIRLRSGRTDRRYPARLVARVEGGSVEWVNHAPIETYVASVVASELNFPEIEAAKAQAILARTYALRRQGEHATYDLFDDQRHQVYRGLATITPTSQRAAQETAGQTLTYNGELADAYYFSSSGGHTANNEALWDGAPIPYLRGVPDPYDTVAPDHSWRTTAPRGAVLRALSNQFGGAVRGVQVERRSPSGRVLTVRLDGGRRATITGSQFRRAVDSAVGARTVRSTSYDISLQGDEYVFTGGGFGHGVGMSQFGAVGQARAGRSHREILAHYFVGTDVSGGSAAPLAAQARPIPRSPGQAEPASALRTRYRAPSGRRWPTPRHQANTQEEVAATAPAPAAPPTAEPPPRRRKAW